MPINGNYEYDYRSPIFRAFNPNVDRFMDKAQPKREPIVEVETGLTTVWNGTHYIQVKNEDKQNEY